MPKARYTPEERRRIKAETLRKNIEKGKLRGYSQKNPDREKALKEGRKFYISGTPCKKCGCVVKFVSSWGCHYCAKKRGYEKLMSGALKKYQTPETNNNKTYRYRTKKAGQTPNLTKEEDLQIREIYRKCAILSEETGIPHHVDHIIPISKGGIHHPSNLQILTASENIRKSNHLWRSQL